MAHESDPRRNENESVDAAFADIIANWHLTAGSERASDASPEDSDGASEHSAAEEAERPAAQTPDGGESAGSAASVPSHDPQDSSVDPGPSTPDAGNAPPHNEPPHRPRTVQEVFGPLDGSDGWRSHTPPEDNEDDEEFVPPAPRSLPAGDLGFWGALIGLVGGPLLLLLIAVFGDGGERFWLMVAIAMTFCGFALLVLRLPARKDPEDDDPDDGAVV